MLSRRGLSRALSRPAAIPWTGYHCQVPIAYGFTEYFEEEVLRKRPYLTKELCIRVVQQSIRDEPQEDNRHRFWAAVPELGDRYLRVVTWRIEQPSTTRSWTGGSNHEG